MKASHDLMMLIITYVFFERTYFIVYRLKKVKRTNIRPVVRLVDLIGTSYFSLGFIPYRPNNITQVRIWERVEGSRDDFKFV